MLLKMAGEGGGANPLCDTRDFFSRIPYFLSQPDTQATSKYSILQGVCKLRGNKAGQNLDGNKATQSIWEVTWQLRSKAFQEYTVSAIKDLSYKWKIYSIASSRAVRQLGRVHKFGS